MLISYFSKQRTCFKAIKTFGCKKIKRQTRTLLCGSCVFKTSECKTHLVYVKSAYFSAITSGFAKSHKRTIMDNCSNFYISTPSCKKFKCHGSNLGAVSLKSYNISRRQNTTKGNWKVIANIKHWIIVKVYVPNNNAMLQCLEDRPGTLLVITGSTCGMLTYGCGCWLKMTTGWLVPITVWSNTGREPPCYNISHHSWVIPSPSHFLLTSLCLQNCQILHWNPKVHHKKNCGLPL